MAKFQVDTLSGVFIFDADSEEQARRLGQDGGRIVVKISELESDDDEANRAAFAPDSDSDFGDDDILVVRRSDYDRLVAYAREGGMDAETAAEIGGADSPLGDVAVDDTPGIVAPGATTVTAPAFEPEQASGDDDPEDRDDGDATPAE
jgi:hypothetical protein